MIRNRNVSQAMTIKLEDVLKELPQPPKFAEGIRRAGFRFQVSAFRRTNVRADT